MNVSPRVRPCLRLLMIFSLFWTRCGFATDVAYQIKASYIYNMLQFVQFPESSLQPDNIVTVCILGPDRFGRALDEIDGASTPQGKVKVVRLGGYSPTMKFGHCNLLYFIESERFFTRDVLRKTQRKHTLTISEFSPFIRYGGLIELYIEDDRMRFRINEALINMTQFKVAAQLIQLGVTSP